MSNDDEIEPTTHTINLLFMLLSEEISQSVLMNIYGALNNEHVAKETENSTNKKNVEKHTFSAGTTNKYIITNPNQRGNAQQAIMNFNNRRRRNAKNDKQTSSVHGHSHARTAQHETMNGSSISVVS